MALRQARMAKTITSHATVLSPLMPLPEDVDVEIHRAMRAVRLLEAVMQQ